MRDERQPRIVFHFSPLLNCFSLHTEGHERIPSATLGPWAAQILLEPFLFSDCGPEDRAEAS